MLKWLIITAAIIIISLLAYKLFLYSPIYSLNSEYRSEEEVSPPSVSYIVTSGISGRISIREIESYTSDKNFYFTRHNLRSKISKLMTAEGI